MFFMMLLMFCNSIRDSFFYPGYSFCTNISRIFYRSVFLSGCTWLFFSITVSTKFSIRVFFNGCVFCSVIFMFRFIRVFLFVISIRFSIRFFYSFFLLFLRCIFVIYRGDLKRKKDFRNQDMFTLQ